jgi:hypothetical protein
MANGYIQELYTPTLLIPCTYMKASREKPVPIDIVSHIMTLFLTVYVFASKHENRLFVTLAYSFLPSLH